MTDLSMTHGAAHMRPNLFSRMLCACKARYASVLTARALSKLSDRDLRDIGISRGEIMAVANGTNCRD